MLRRRLHRYPGIFAALLALATPLVSSGQTKEPTPIELAQTLFDKASEEMDQGRYAPACRKLEEVTRLVPDKIGGIETLGECYEKLGKLASAWSAYTAAAAKAREQGQTPRAATLAKQAAALARRLSRLTLEVPEPVRRWPSLAIKINGVPVAKAQWGTAVPIDGGENEIVATAPGYKPFRKTIQVAQAGAKEQMVIGPFEVEPSTGIGPGVTAPDTPPATDGARSWQRPAGIAAIAAGAAGMVIGAAFGGAAINANTQSNEHCIAGNRCDKTGFALRNDALAFGNASTGFIVAGGALAAAGLALVIISRTPEMTDKKDTTKERRPLPDRKDEDIYKAPAVIYFAGNAVWLRGAW
jgi:hypothetical protein